MNKYEADRIEMFRAADLSMMCEEHPGREWPHDDCPGPGTPWILDGRTLIEEVIAREAPGHAALLEELDDAAERFAAIAAMSRSGNSSESITVFATSSVERIHQALTLHKESPTQE